MTESTRINQYQNAIPSWNRHAEKMIKRMFALALFGTAWLLLSGIWLWIAFQPPSIGYDCATGVAVIGEAHVPSKVFEYFAWWMAILSILSGLLLIIGFSVRSNSYSSYAYFVYMILAVLQAILSLCLIVFFLLLALGSTGHLDSDLIITPSPSAISSTRAYTTSLRVAIIGCFSRMYGPQSKETLALGISIFMMIYSFFAMVTKLGTIFIVWKVYYAIDGRDISRADYSDDLTHTHGGLANNSATGVRPNVTYPLSGPRTQPNFTHLTGFTQSEMTGTLDSNQRFTNFPSGYKANAQLAQIQKTQQEEPTDDGETHYEKVNTVMNPAETKKGKSSNQKNVAASHSKGTLAIEIDSKDMKPSASGPSSTTAIAQV